MEKDFAKPVAATKPQTSVGGVAPKVEVVKVTLLGPDRTKNMELILGKLKIPFETIAESLITCDFKILTLTNLESLELIAPNEEEAGLLKAYDGDKTLLGNPEKFVD